LALMVARLMRTAGATASDERLAALAAFANEQFTLVAELIGHRAPAEHAAFAGLAERTYRALWQSAVESREDAIHFDICHETVTKSK
jgi:hypothetical protein